MDKPNTFPGSRFYPIGGTFYRVSVRRKAVIKIEVSDKDLKDAVLVHGSVQPKRGDQLIMLSVLLPDGKTRNVGQTTTQSTGDFEARLSLLSKDKKILSGPYRVKAYILNASELADSESNEIQFKR